MQIWRRKTKPNKPLEPNCKQILKCGNVFYLHKEGPKAVHIYRIYGRGVFEYAGQWMSDGGTKIHKPIPPRGAVRLRGL